MSTLYPADIAKQARPSKDPLTDPIKFPLEFKQWLVNYLQQELLVSQFPDYSKSSSGGGGTVGPPGPAGPAGPPGPTAVSTNAGNQATLGSDSLLFVPDKWINTTGDTMTGTLTLAADPAANLQASTKQYVDNSISGLSSVYMRWVPYTGPPQTFLKQDVTRDGDWTMVANKNTSDRPSPQASGTEEDLLPAWTPATQSAPATYTVYNEWTLNQGGWIDQYGVDILSQNLGASHTITLRVGGVVKDTFTATPNTAGIYWHDVTPLLVASGAVIRVSLQVTRTGSNSWFQQAGLFATAPVYCSLAQGSKDGATAGTTAYGCHLLLIPGTYSPDWDVLAFGGSAAEAAGGTGSGGVTGLLTGQIPAAGTTATAGTGFTYTHASVGVYAFTFTTAYTAAPSVVVVANDDNYRVTVSAVSTTGFTVHVQNMTLYPSQVGTLADGPFTFIAMATV